jgi:hypothetical protein
VHASCGSRLGGVHFELTGENVTECVGGPEKLLEGDLPARYTTYCDPRLNYAQSMEVAFLVAQYLAQEREEQLSRESGVPASEFVGAGADAEAAAGDGFGHPSARSDASDGSGVAGGVHASGPPRFAAGRGFSPEPHTK